MLLRDVEHQFVQRGRTPKGQRTLQSIFRATEQIVAEHGLSGASLDLIADRAGLTQAALRHYFPTREELLSRFFVVGTEWFQASLARLLDRLEVAPRDLLEQCIGWHLDYMEQVDTALWLESSAYWLRHAEAKRMRDEWYAWLAGRYAALIGRIQPSIGLRERERRAHVLLTLILGAWVTHGRGSAIHSKGSASERRQVILDAAMDVACH